MGDACCPLLPPAIIVILILLLCYLSIAVSAFEMPRHTLDPHAYTALPILASRAIASDSPNAIMNDPLAAKLLKATGGTNLLTGASANVEYMTMRALIGDELTLQQHSRGVRQLVSIGAGMDSRAFRLGLKDTTFLEVDSVSLFDTKEPLVKDVPLQCAARHTVRGFIGQMDLAGSLSAAGFNASEPTTWLMEGLLPYLTVPVMTQLAKDIGALSAPGSALWGDSFSKASVDKGMVFHGVPFESGFDNYDALFRDAGFQAEAIDFAGIWLDRKARATRMDPRHVLTAGRAQGRRMCLMVRAFKGSSLPVAALPPLPVS